MFAQYLCYVFQGVYGDNGSLMYHHGYGYAPYGPYSPAASPVPTMGDDGQLYGPQHYQYPPYFQPLTPTSAPYTPSPGVPQSEVSTSVAADQKPLPVEAANGNSNGIVNSGSAKGNNGSAPLKPAYQNSSFNSNGSYARGPLPGRVSTPGYQDPRFGFDGLRSGIPCLDPPLFSDWQPRPVTSTAITSSISNGNNMPSSRNQNYRPNSQFMVLLICPHLLSCYFGLELIFVKLILVTCFLLLTTAHLCYFFHRVCTTLDHCLP